MDVTSGLASHRRLALASVIAVAGLALAACSSGTPNNAAGGTTTTTSSQGSSSTTAGGGVHDVGGLEHRRQAVCAREQRPVGQGRHVQAHLRRDLVGFHRHPDLRAASAQVSVQCRGTDRRRGDQHGHRDVRVLGCGRPLVLLLVQLFHQSFRPAPERDHRGERRSRRFTACSPRSPQSSRASRPASRTRPSPARPPSACRGPTRATRSSTA